MAELNTVQELATGIFKIINEGDSARNFPKIQGQSPVITPITFDRTPVGKVEEVCKFEEWTADQSGIRNVGSGYWACAHNDQVDGCSVYDPKTCKWFVERVEGGKYKVFVPHQNLCWTVKPGYPKTLFLEPAIGTPAQLFSFERVVD